MDNKLITTLDVSYDNGLINAKITTVINDEKLEFAFYLIRGRERIETHWYTNSKEHSFNVFDTPGVYSVTAFARVIGSKNPDIIYSKKIAIKNKTSGIKRTIRLKEWPPLSNIIKTPSDEYLDRVENLPKDNYEINTDENGFILTSEKNNKKPLWLFFGDSFVESIFVHNGKRFTDVLAGIFEHVSILNGGYSGTTTLQIINSIINKAIPLSPEKIFIFIPSNDSRCIKLEGGYWNNTKLLSPIIGTLDGNEHKFDFGDDLSQLELALNLIKDITVRIGCKLYLGTTPHRHLNYLGDPYLKSRYPNQSYFNKVSTERLNVGNHVRKWCVRENISLIDLEKEMDCFMDFSYDEVHLNEHGSTFAAKVIERHLNNGV
ncbi:SGNH/GDSL hydrolase family protein [Aeromonas media]|uniref:SGNH/GDSL hydrolase family protein n=1 Tax=Aeromonas media TaxID=651 RepID=UPI00295509C7|nr:SGNH/GDSL hydrolase family protein [Aeromonas media]WOQ11919.1 SGNH/GDSL hydrolase family protein [Aeromonas media]